MVPIFGLMAPLESDQDTLPKFTKEQVNFREQGVAFYVCGRCRLYREEEKKCQIVSEAGDPSPGEINPDDLCDLWNAGPIRQKLRERRFGRGPETPS